MRNIFDQYDQPENKLTHALVSTLSHDRQLIRPFLHWLKAKHIPPTREINITEQEIPGLSTGGDEQEKKGLPDACFYNQDDWAVLVESKVQAGINREQLKRHLRTARRHGYENPHIALIAVNRPARVLPKGMHAVRWCDVYRWFLRRRSHSHWAKIFLEYMHTFESKMLAKDYNIKGTITMFDGFHFDDETPYTYREGKRLIRLMGDELQKRKDLFRFGVDPKGERRTAITGRGRDGVWDFLPLKVARKKKTKKWLFTAYPHLTMGIGSREIEIVLTVPNGIRGGFRTKLQQKEVGGFRALVSKLERRLRFVTSRSINGKPSIYILQRHYKSQRSHPEKDGHLRVDLRAIRRSAQARVKYQPQWFDAIYEILVNKRSNIQFGISVHFPYTSKVIQSRKSLDLFAKCWIAMKPLLDFVLSK